VAVSTARCSVPDAIAEILQALDPLPAVVNNARFDILAETRRTRTCSATGTRCPASSGNTLWCCLTEPTARDKFPQYAGSVRHNVARFRAAYARHVATPTGRRTSAACPP